MYDLLTTHSSPRETSKRIQKEHRKNLVGAHYTTYNGLEPEGANDPGAVRSHAHAHVSLSGPPVARVNCL